MKKALSLTNLEEYDRDFLSYLGEEFAIYQKSMPDLREEKSHREYFQRYTGQHFRNVECKEFIEKLKTEVGLAISLNPKEKTKNTNVGYIVNKIISKLEIPITAIAFIKGLKLSSYEHNKIIKQRSYATRKDYYRIAFDIESNFNSPDNIDKKIEPSSILGFTSSKKVELNEELKTKLPL